MISITIDAEDGFGIRDQMAKVLGLRIVDDGLAGRFVDNTISRPPAPQVRETFVREPVGVATEEEAEAIAAGGGSLSGPATSAAPTVVRERGKPSPGHARRTKAEIAEDEAKDHVDAEMAAMSKISAGPITIVSETGVTEEDVPLISTGEERVGPEDDAATQQQDAADEAAETAGDRAAGEGKLTLDDVRNVLGLYVKGYGLPAAQEDGPKIIAEVCGEGKVKVSDVPDDKIAEVIAAVKAAGKANRFARTAVTS